MFTNSWSIKKNGGFYTRCITCREQNNQYIRTKKRKKTNEIQESGSIFSYEELDQHLSKLINDIGQEKFWIWNKIFCFIDISFLSNKTSKEIADDVKNFIGYYYM